MAESRGDEDEQDRKENRDGGRDQPRMASCPSVVLGPAFLPPTDATGPAAVHCRTLRPHECLRFATPRFCVRRRHLFDRPKTRRRSGADPAPGCGAPGFRSRAALEVVQRDTRSARPHLRARPSSRAAPLKTLDPKGRDTLRRVLIHDQTAYTQLSDPESSTLPSSATKTQA